MRTGGISKNPDSSMKTMCAPNRLEFFLPAASPHLSISEHAHGPAPWLGGQVSGDSTLVSSSPPAAAGRSFRGPCGHRLPSRPEGRQGAPSRCKGPEQDVGEGSQCGFGPADAAVGDRNRRETVKPTSFQFLVLSFEFSFLRGKRLIEAFVGHASRVPGSRDGCPTKGQHDHLLANHPHM